MRCASRGGLRHQHHVGNDVQRHLNNGDQGVGTHTRACAEVCFSRHTGCVVSLVQKRAIILPGWLLEFITPQRDNSGALQSGGCTLLHPRRLCTQLCRRVRRIHSGIILSTLGARMLPAHGVSAKTTSSPLVRIWDLL